MLIKAITIAIIAFSIGVILCSIIGFIVKRNSSLSTFDKLLSVLLFVILIFNTVYLGYIINEWFGT